MGFVIPLVIASMVLGFVLYVRYYANGGLYRRYCTHIHTSLKGKTVLVTGKSDTIRNIRTIIFYFPILLVLNRPQLYLWLYLSQFVDMAWCYFSNYWSLSVRNVSERTVPSGLAMTSSFVWNRILLIVESFSWVMVIWKKTFFNFPVI